MTRPVRRRVKVLGALGDARLRRRLQLLPLPGRRGRPGREPLPRPQPDAPSSATSCAHDFGLDGSQLEQFGRYVEQTAAAQPRPLVHDATSPSSTRSGTRRRPTIALVGISTLLSMVVGVADRHRRGLAARHLEGHALTSSSMVTWSMPDFWLGMLLLAGFSFSLGLFPTGGISDPDPTRRASRSSLDQAWHMFLPCAHARRSPTSASTRSSCARRCSTRCARTT